MGDTEINIDAQEYVATIMASQIITRVDTPAASGRKRNMSSQGSVESTVKKARNSVDSSGSPGSTGSPDSVGSSDSVAGTDRVIASARRSLYGSNAPTPAPRRIVVTDAEGHVNATPSLEDLITNLSRDVHKMYASLADRIDKLESGLEQRISNKVAQLLDKRVSTEMSRFKKDVDKRLDTLKDSMMAEVAVDLEEINSKVSALSESSSSASATATDISLNVVIRNLPESTSESTSNKVNALLRDGLKLKDVSVKSAVRKTSLNNKPGVVIATMKSQNDKAKIMEKKVSLKHNRQYERVYINHDQSRQERLFADNFRAILSAMKQRDTNLTIRGSRVVRGDLSQRQGYNRMDTRSGEQRQDRREVGNDRDQGRAHVSGNDARGTRGGPRAYGHGGQNQQKYNNRR